MHRKEKILLSLLLVGALGSMAAFGVLGAFSSTTSNLNNSFAAGTVVLADNDANSSLYTVSNAKPGDTVTRCIRVTYTGTLGSDARIYTLSPIGALGPYVDLTIQPGTMPGATAFPNCTGFTADPGGALYTGTLQNFGSTRNSYANGVVDFPGATSSWATNDDVVYQVTAQLQASAPDTAQGATTGSHTIT
ncbi:MAG: hypothetical protein EXQ70_08495 [Solirubrobacterales bacterium]|nr:hypothetical protein [Solirubrobacterales bacterium]